MKKLLPIFFTLTLVLGVLSINFATQPTQAQSGTTYIFATFDGDGASEQELWIYTSTDGLNWNLFADTNYQGPTGTLRDPSIIKHNGIYYVAYTNQHWGTTSTSFNIASSPDLINWTHVTTVNAGVSGTGRTWAPEFFVEDNTVYVIVSLGPPPSPYAFREYYYTAQNTDLTSWSGPTLMDGIGPNIIDTFVVKVGNTYHAFTQNGDSLYIEHATATNLSGPWTYIATGDWAGWGSGKEGPALFQLDDGTWTLFADWYSTNGIYRATSSNLTSWSSPLTSVSSLSTKRHGTVLRDTSFGSDEWTFCANEGEFCSFSGTQEVRYGANGSYNYGTFTNGVDCNNSVFGDPIQGTVKQCHYRAPDTTPTPTNTPSSGSNPISQANWSLQYVDSEELSGEDGAATNAFDGNTGTIWHTQWQGGSPGHPHEIQINLGGEYSVDGFRYLPRQDGNENGRISQYEFYVSTSPSNWGSAVATGTFANSSSEKEVTFAAKTGQYVRLVALSEVNGNAWTSAAEINVLGTATGGPTATPTNTPVGPTDTPTPTPTNTPTPTPTATPSGSGPISQANWSLEYVDSEELSGEDGAATNAFDGNTGTIWHTQWQGGSPGHPHEIQINLGASYEVNGFRYLPRQDGSQNGRISQYEFYVSTSPSNWGSAVATGTFANSSSEKEVTFAAKTGQYVRLVALSEVNGNAWTSAAEINVLGTGTGGPTATPTNTPASSSTYQAEDASVGGGATVDTNHSGYNGSGFVNFPTNGGFVEYQNVNGGSGGSRTLQFRFALGASSARTGSLIVNGSSQNITFQPTGSWDSWSVQNVTVTLNSGSSNTIRLESTGQDLANQDQMTVN